MAWLEPHGIQAAFQLKNIQGMELNVVCGGGGSGGWHLGVQENDPLLGNKEVDATSLVASSFLHFGALGPENIRPAEEQGGCIRVCFSASDTSSATRDRHVRSGPLPAHEAINPWPLLPAGGGGGLGFTRLHPHPEADVLTHLTKSTA